MTLTFDLLLREADIPREEVRLVRHQDTRGTRGRTPYRLWQDDRTAFESYQAGQSFSNRAKLAHPQWAVFVGTPDGGTLFVGLYDVRYKGVAETAFAGVLNDLQDPAGTYDAYELQLSSKLSEYIGKLYIEWGEGYRAWIQRADGQEKPIVEIRRSIREPDFPGYLHFLKQLSEIENLPAEWNSALVASKGVYLLTCPRTREQYVGSATGKDGFLGRWLNYVRTGDGGNVALVDRPSDYRVSILEVAASSATVDEICALESLWKEKLQSREMGLNRN
jgi:hypothetical protein